MIYSAGDAQPHRVMVINKPTRLTIQAIAPNAVRLGKSQSELITQVGAVSDGITIDATQLPGGLWTDWWSGEVWIQMAAGGKCVVMLPLLHEEIFIG